MKVYGKYYASTQIPWENVILEIWIKMILASQVEGFLNQLNFQNKTNW